MVRPAGRNHRSSRMRGDLPPSRFNGLNLDQSSTRNGRPIRSSRLRSDGLNARLFDDHESSAGGLGSAARPSEMVRGDAVDGHPDVPRAIRDPLSAFEDSSSRQKSVYSYNTGHMSGPNGVRSIDDVRRKVIRPDDSMKNRKFTESPSKIIVAIIGVVIVLAIVKVLLF